VLGDDHAGKVYENAGALSLTYPDIPAEVGKVIGAEAENVDQNVENHSPSASDNKNHKRPAGITSLEGRVP